MENENWINVSTNLVKIGNSFSVRIPMQVVKEINAEEGRIIALKVKKLKLEISPEVLDQFYQAAKKSDGLKEFSDEKIYLMARLCFNEGKFVLNKVDNKLDEDLNQQKKMKEALDEYRSNIKKQFGEKLYEDFLLFRENVDKLMLNKN